ncbi:MAG: ChbG/HpnK family deacetylase [Candidatus Abyssobacteria bacterium SURF_5]|uniref:ChbG/HpnK family deacetylase n=1 Tax=Abyssobacteria bacterium (strain SURF_5) TaxID=2093360 RepID=A0A3A4N495_ABYX5|nr:MAG: ChbG/HpnK family deacetylase [Candidatus Abyssubacteria bacterium SURF_5]
MATLLIVNADDFGLEKEINTAVIRAHEEGIVTSASLLAVGDAFEHAVELAKKHPRLGVGAHLALTRGPSLKGKPLIGSETSSVTGGTGRFSKSPIIFAMRAALRLVDAGELEKEFRAQLERITSAGIPITHIDSHQHIHLAPPIFAIVIGLALEFGISWVRMPFAPVRTVGCNGDIGGKMKKALLRRLAAWNLRTLRGTKLRWADYHVGIEHAGCLREDALLRVLQELPDAVVELSCHPGADNAALNRDHPWGYCWREELAALCSQETAATVKRLGIRLVNYAGWDEEAASPT